MASGSHIYFLSMQKLKEYIECALSMNNGGTAGFVFEQWT